MHIRASLLTSCLHLCAQTRITSRAPRHLLTTTSTANLEDPPRDRKDELQRDLDLSRELILHAEYEIGAIREEVAILQEKLAEVLTRPDRRRKLQNKIGGLVNTLKFKSGDLYQRKNELRRKEAAYRLACERSSGGRSSLSSSSSTGKLVGRGADRFGASTTPGLGRTEAQGAAGASDDSSSLQPHPYLLSIESVMQEDELRRQEIVEKFMVLAKMRASTASTSRQKHKELVRRKGSPSKSSSNNNHPGPFRRGDMALSPSAMTPDEVAAFVDALDLGCELGAKFKAQGIDGSLLLQATDRDLEELGVSLRLHRVRILGAVESASKEHDGGGTSEQR